MLFFILNKFGDYIYYFYTNSTDPIRMLSLIGLDELSSVTVLFKKRGDSKS